MSGLGRILDGYVADDRVFDLLEKLRKMSQEEFDEYLKTLCEDEVTVNRNLHELVGKRVTVKCVSGRSYIGRVFCIDDAEDNEDSVEDALALDLDGGGVVTLFVSEIKAVEII